MAARLPVLPAPLLGVGDGCGLCGVHGAIRLHRTHGFVRSWVEVAACLWRTCCLGGAVRRVGGLASERRCDPATLLEAPPPYLSVRAVPFIRPVNESK